MVKKTSLPRTRGESTKSSRGRKRIAAVIAELDQIKPPSPKAADTIAVLKSWLADESGYDEKVWPGLKKALERRRENVKARRLFDA
jgi:hypothetical protein